MLTPQKILDALKADQTGCSFDSRGDRPPDCGYMVSMRGLEVRLPQDIVPYGILSAYLEWVTPVLRAEGHYLGVWYDGTHTYLDVSYWVYGLEEALSLAADHEQLAFYSLEEKRSIPL